MRWGSQASTRYTHCQIGKGNLRGWFRERMERGVRADFIPSSKCKEMESKRGQMCRTREDLDDKRWIIIVPKGGRQGGRGGGVVSSQGVLQPDP